MEITALVHDCSHDGETGFAATCAEFPEANGQGGTDSEAIANLRDAIRDVLDYRREEALKSLSATDRIQMLPA